MFWYVQTLTFQLKEAKMYLETTVTVLIQHKIATGRKESTLIQLLAKVLEGLLSRGWLFSNQ